MKTFAPVLIPTLNRIDHFKRCIESLSKCTYADKTDLYIALDYPSHESHRKGYELIKDYLQSIIGFNNVTIIERDINYGVRKNINEAQKVIFEKFDRMILSEDDNIFSVDFLNYINKGLETYKDRSDIFSISGYNYPVIMPTSYKKEVYLWQGYSAWGVGIWKDKWSKIEWDQEKGLKIIRDFLKEYKGVYNYQKVANHYIPAKIEMIKQSRLLGDGYISLYLFLNNMYSIFPTVSRVRNMGHDGSGINCGSMEDNIYARQEIYFGESNYDLPLNIKPSNDINELLYQHFKIPFKSKVKLAGKLFLLNNGLWLNDKS